MKPGSDPYQLAPPWASSGILAAGVVVSWLFLGGESPSVMATVPAWIMTAALLTAFLVDFHLKGPQQVIRADNAALAAAYYLLFFEHLFPQPALDEQISAGPARAALRLMLLGFLGLTLGRHLLPPRKKAHPARLPSPSDAALLILLLSCFCLGYLHLFASVNFHPGRLLEGMLSPRQEQPWARERLGDWQALISEMNLLTFLIPPMAANYLARNGRQRSWRIILVCFLLGFVFLTAFTTGTRYVFAAHLATFSASLLLSLERLSRRRAMVSFAATALLLVFVTFFALQFRRTGLGDLSSSQATPTRIMVDNNLRSIATLTEHFPNQSAFLGSEVLYHALIRPIPRALWPGKPTKLSVSMEEVMGIPQTSIASSFVGEGYLAFGIWGSLGFGLAIGLLLAAWNRLLSSRHHSSDLILYASGFYGSILVIRSPIWITVGLLPCVAFAIAALLLFPLARTPSQR